MGTAKALAADGHPVDPDDLATIASYITRTIRRFGNWVLDLSPPEAAPVTALNLALGALFPAADLTRIPGDPLPGARGLVVLAAEDRGPAVLAAAAAC